MISRGPCNCCKDAHCAALVRVVALRGISPSHNTKLRDRLAPRWKEQSSLCLMLDFLDQLVSLVEGLHSASTDFWKTQTCLCQELWSRLRSSAWHGPQSSTKFWDLAWLQWCTAWLNLVDVDLIQPFLRVALLVEEDAVVGVLPNVDTGKPFPLAIFPIWKSSAKLPHFLWRLSTKSRCRWGNRQHGSLQLKPASRGPPCLEDKSALIALELCPSKLLHGHDTFLPPVSRCMIQTIKCFTDTYSARASWGSAPNMVAGSDGAQTASSSSSKDISVWRNAEVTSPHLIRKVKLDA